MVEVHVVVIKVSAFVTVSKTNFRIETISVRKS